MSRVQLHDSTVTIQGNSTVFGNTTAVMSTTQFPVLNSTGVNYTNVASSVANFGIASAGTTADTGHRIRILGAMITAPSSCLVYFGADTAVSSINGIMGTSTHPIAVAANGGFVLPLAPLGMWWFQTSANTTAAAVHLNFCANTTGPFGGVVVWTAT